MFRYFNDDCKQKCFEWLIENITQVVDYLSSLSNEYCVDCISIDEIGDIVMKFLGEDYLSAYKFAECNNLEFRIVRNSRTNINIADEYDVALLKFEDYAISIISIQSYGIDAVKNGMSLCDFVIKGIIPSGNYFMYSVDNVCNIYGSNNNVVKNYFRNFGGEVVKTEKCGYREGVYVSKYHVIKGGNHYEFFVSRKSVRYLPSQVDLSVKNKVSQEVWDFA